MKQVISFFTVRCLSILNTSLGSKYWNGFWRRAVYCIIKYYSCCKCGVGQGKVLLTGTPYEACGGAACRAYQGRAAAAAQVSGWSRAEWWMVSATGRSQRWRPARGAGPAQPCLELSPASVAAAEMQRISGSLREEVEGGGRMALAGLGSALSERLPWVGWVCLPHAGQSRQFGGSPVPGVCY